MKYKAFISYSHSEDSQFSPALQSIVEKYAKKWYQTRRIRIFRDETNLAISPGLWSSIVEALEATEFFVFLASPASAKSKWVTKEVQWWLKNRDKQKLLIILTSGNIYWDEASGSLAGDSVPGALSTAFDAEPFYLDLRWVRESSSHVSSDNIQFQNALVPLASVLLDEDMDRLVGENARQIKIRRQFIQLTTTLLAVLCIFLVYLSFSLSEQTKLAISARDEAKSNELLSNYNLAKMHEEKSLSLVNDGFQGVIAKQEAFQKSWLYALEALKLDIPQDKKHLSDVLLGTINTSGVVQLLSKAKRNTIALPATESAVKAISYRSDGKVVVVKANNAVHLLEPKSGTLIKSKSYDQAIAQVAVNKDGGLVALDLGNGSIQLLDTHSWEQKVTIKTSGKVTALAFNNDSTSLAVGQDMGDYRNYSVRLWDVSTGDAIKATMAKGEVNALTFNEDGSLLVFGLGLWEVGAMGDLVEYGDTIEIWNIRDQTTSFEGDYSMISPVQQITYSPDWSRLIAGSWDVTASEHVSRITAWDIHPEGLKREQFIDGYTGIVRKMNYSPKSDSIAIGSSDNSIRILNGSSLKEEFSFDNGADIRALAYSPEGNRIASNNESGGLTIWDVSFSKPVKVPASEGEILATSVDGTLIVAVVDDILVFKNNETGNVTKMLDQGFRSVSAATISPSGNEVVYATKDNELVFWDTQEGQLTSKIGDFLDLTEQEMEYYSNLSNPNTHHMSVAFPTGFLTSLSFSPDGTILAAGTSNDTLQVWNASKSDERVAGMPAYGSELRGHADFIDRLAFNKDGSLLASASYDGTVNVWRIESGDIYVSGVKKQVIQCESVKQMFFDDTGELHVVGASGGVDHSCMPNTFTYRLFDEFNPHIVSRALELIWGVRFNDDRTALVGLDSTNSKGQVCGSFEGVDNCALLAAPAEKDTKLDQLIKWLEDECAYKDERLRTECLN